MANDVKWIKITTDMFDDEKIDFITSLPEADAIIVIWIRLLSLAGKCNAGGYIYLTERIPYTEDMLSHKFRKPITIIKLALETFQRLGMIEYDENIILINNWGKHQNIEGMEKLKERDRDRKRIERANKKILLLEETSKDIPWTVQGQSDENPLLDIDKDLDIDKETTTVFFESIWKLYPKKEGKGQVSKAQKEKLHKVGIEEITRSISRYIKAKEGKDKQYLQNGSTFFNSGYVDYLDGNYQEVKPNGRLGVTEGEGAGERRPDM